MERGRTLGAGRAGIGTPEPAQPRTTHPLCAAHRRPGRPGRPGPGQSDKRPRPPRRSAAAPCPAWALGHARRLLTQQAAASCRPSCPAAQLPSLQSPAGNGATRLAGASCAVRHASCIVRHRPASGWPRQRDEAAAVSGAHARGGGSDACTEKGKLLQAYPWWECETMKNLMTNKKSKNE